MTEGPPCILKFSCPTYHVTCSKGPDIKQYITYNMLTVDFLLPVGDMLSVARSDCRHDLVSVEF